MGELKTFKFPVLSPCCNGASLGINTTFYGYKIYGCKGCGRTINRPLAIKTIRKARVILKESLAFIASEFPPRPPKGVEKNERKD